MTSVRVLTGPETSHSWDEAIESLPVDVQDSYYRWAYLNLQQEDGSTPHLLTYESNGHTYLSAFLLRTVTSIRGQALEEPILDIETAYGYGGPLATTHDAGFLSNADKAFRDWCADIGITAEFLRFHPILRTQEFAGAGVTTELNRTTYSITVDEARAPLAHFDSKARNMVRRALAGGLQAETLTGKTGADDFQTLYRQTMRRVGADAEYDFSEQYFARLAALPPEELRIVTVSDAHGIHSMGTFLIGAAGIHYHLSASRDDNLVPGATNLLLHEAVSAALDLGRQWVHLGGGLRSDGTDPLARFKRSVSDTEHSYYIGKRIHRPENWKRAMSILAAEGMQQRTSSRLLAYHSQP